MLQKIQNHGNQVTNEKFSDKEFKEVQAWKLKGGKRSRDKGASIKLLENQLQSVCDGRHPLIHVAFCSLNVR